MQIEKLQRKRLRYFLRGLPSLQLSDTGLKNTAKRFGLTIEEVKAEIETAKTLKTVKNSQVSAL